MSRQNCTTSDCPTDAELQSLASGTLDAKRAERVDQCLLECADCLAVATRFDEKERRPAVDTAKPVPRAEAALVRDSLAVRQGEDEPPPRYLRNLRLVEQIGSGGMGTVYKALHEPLDRTVAVKVLSPHRLSSSDAVRRFCQEMKAVGKLSHPNILHAFDAGEHDGTHFLVTEYVDGADVSRIVRAVGRLSIPDACEIIRQAAEGLHHAHHHNLIHRDVKPSNLMLGTDGRVKLLDLGLARLAAQPTESSEMTDRGQVIGTMEYMSPEQAMDSHRVDIRTDIYSLGATFYKLLCGTAPFADRKYSTMTSRILALSQDQPTPAQELRGDLPDTLAGVLRRMMARNPDDRYATADEVACVLRPFSVGHQLSALACDAAVRTSRPPELGQPATVLVPPPARRVSTQAEMPRRSTQRLQRSNWIRRFIAIVAMVVIALGGVILFVRGPLRYDASNPGRGQTSEPASTPDPGDTVAELSPPDRPRPADRPFVSSIHEPSTKALASLRADLRLVPADPLAPPNREFRQRLVAFAAAHRGSPAESEAARLMQQVAWPVDLLKRERLDATHLRSIGFGDPGQGPPQVVAVLGSNRFTHGNKVNAVKFSSDGTLVVSAGDDRVVMVWDAQTGTAIHQFLGHSGRIMCLDISRDKRLVVSGATDKTLRVWDLVQGRCVREFAPGEVVGPVSISPDGEFILSGIRGSQVTLWDLKKDEPVERFDLDEGCVHRVAFAPDGGTFAAVTCDGLVSVWSLTEKCALWKQRPPLTLPHGKGAIRAVAYCQRGTQVLATTGANKVFRWDARTGEPKGELWESNSITAVGVDETGNQVVAASNNDTLTVWELDSGEKRSVYVPKGSFTDLAVNSRTQRAVMSDMQSVRLIDLAAGKDVPEPYTEGAYCVRVDSLGEHFLSGHLMGTVRLWQAADGQLSRTIRQHAEGAVFSARFFADDSRMVSGSTDGSATLWSFSEQQRLRVIPPDPSHHSVVSVAVTPDSSQVALGSYFGSIRLFALPHLDNPRVIRAHSNGVSSMMFTPDGRRLVSTSWGGEACIWDVDTLRKVAALPPLGSNGSVAMSPDGAVLATGSSRGDVQTWLAKDGTHLRDFPKHHQFVISGIDFSPDGSRIATVGCDGRVCVWSIDPPGLVQIIRLGTDNWEFKDVTFTPDGRHLVTANLNGTLCVLRLRQYSPPSAPSDTAEERPAMSPKSQ